MQNNLDKLHKEQLIELQKKIRKKYNEIIIKPSPELINLNKKLELYIQRKDYQNAHQMQIDIANLTKKEREKKREKFEKEKYINFQKEIENLEKSNKMNQKA